MKKEIKMTIKEAYMAMQYFLEQFYDRTGSDDVGGLLGDMLLTDKQVIEFYHEGTIVYGKIE